MARRGRRKKPQRTRPEPQPATDPPVKPSPVRPWTAAEDEVIENAISQMADLRRERRREIPSPMKRAAAELGRSYGALRARASLLGLSVRRWG